MEKFLRSIRAINSISSDCVLCGAVIIFLLGFSISYFIFFIFNEMVGFPNVNNVFRFFFIKSINLSCLGVMFHLFAFCIDGKSRTKNKHSGQSNNPS